MAEKLHDWRGWPEGADALRTQVLVEVELDCASST